MNPLKRRWVIILLVLLTFWPLAHRVLVAKFNVNPWKLAGWAMFCVPNPKTKVRPYGISKDGTKGPFTATPEDIYEINIYNHRRGILGSLAPHPDEIAKRVLARHPELEGVGVNIYQYHVDLKTALLKWKLEKGLALRE
ncbi:MAG: hypothetical protein MK538_20800 [Planctomycetes bacterium]|nr:hypothetical protein [Planctomycetota bacterium]|tara:strand:- start:38 stop:454 length:417 start_codon:yes stop_codon:yes gene_type:complete